MPDEVEEKGVGNPIEGCANKKDDPPPPEKKKDFISFNIVDEKGDPMKDVLVKVKLPDGSLEEKASDENGLVEIKDIDSGECKVLFEWKGLKEENVVLLQD